MAGHGRHGIDTSTPLMNDGIERFCEPDVDPHTGWHLWHNKRPRARQCSADHDHLKRTLLTRRASSASMASYETSHRPAGVQEADLGRHVVEGAGAGDRALLVRVDGQPEVGELDAGTGHQDVLRLDVPVHHALCVHVVQRQQRRPQNLCVGYSTGDRPKLWRRESLARSRHAVIAKSELPRFRCHSQGRGAVIQAGAGARA